MIRNNNPLNPPLLRGTSSPDTRYTAPAYDLERMNFLAWYRDATVEEIAIARRNGAARLDALIDKYKKEIALMDIVNGR